MMEAQLLFNLIGGLATLGLSGYVSYVHKQLAALKKENEVTKDELHAFELRVAREHPTDDDMREIKATLLRIEAKLDQKVDK